MKIYRREESSLYQGKKKDIHKRTYIQKKEKQQKKTKKTTKKQLKNAFKLLTFCTNICKQCKYNYFYVDLNKT